MRWIVRLFAVLIMLGGLGAGLAYPRLATSVSLGEIGRWAVFDRATGFETINAELPALNHPILARLTIRVNGPLVLANDGALITITGSIDGRTVLARAVNVGEIKGRLVDPQSAHLEADIDVGAVEIRVRAHMCS